MTLSFTTTCRFIPALRKTNMTREFVRLGAWWNSGVPSLIAVLLLLAMPTVCKTNGQSDASDREEESLIAVLKDGRIQDEERERLEKAINRLGELRSTAAINNLVDLLTFRSTTQKDTFDHDTSPLGRYPAAGALYHIGRPALGAL
jgi:hypothetical protein